MKDIECPYCNVGLDICHDDGYGYEEGIKHQMECPGCRKSFVFETTISFSYDAYKADCLNGKKHDYQLTNTYPEEFSKMECTMCDDRRELTSEERIKFKINSKQSYFDNLKYGKDIL